ncbi:hypothetical protein J7E73_10820 [Paenibacillus albidus]|uniref:hypothetical protein n=1 Tax=Paenibacillus albidus TaxID=2041023 RepID=UPI001BEC7E4D|nr:hypothetical protein [Paenibacillus albidus]MBT2289617.1 hypothetical protein [Paenibacillus albidus]
MIETLELRLEAAPGLLSAAWVPLSGTAGKPEAGLNNRGISAEFRLSLEVPVWRAARREEILQQIAHHPNELFALLEGRLTGGCAKLDPDLFPPEDVLMQAIVSQAESVDAKKVLELIRNQLAQKPLLAFTLKGLSKEDLLEGVFAQWAEGEQGAARDEAAAPLSAGSLAAELTRLERKGPAVSTGEWLAEAVAEGSLHQPGPLFHEIEARPFPASQPVAAPAEDWGALLPKTPKAQEGVALIMNRVAEAAARKAQSILKPK